MLKSSITTNTALIADIRKLIDGARQRVAQMFNAELSLLYWQIGQRLKSVILNGERAEYGNKIIKNLSKKLTVLYGRGWSEKQLWHCLRFVETFPSIEKVSTLWRQLSWSHIKTLIYMEDTIKRDFYTQLAIMEGWSYRQFKDQLNSMLYERTALSKQPDELIKQELEMMQKTGSPAPAILLKDPYVLDFLDLNDRYFEKDLEDAILREMEQFLLELGAGFTFIARQKRMQIDNDDFYLDLLFYNRKLKRLVAIELKLGDFQADYKGQMELYLRWLAKYETEKDENPPLGIILCAGKKHEQIELLELNKSGIHVAEYLTVLPPREILQAKLQHSIEHARRSIESKEDS